MRKLLTGLMALGVMAATGVVTTTSAEAHWRNRGCCTYMKRVRYYKPVTMVVKKVGYVRVRSYRTYLGRKYYGSRWGCRRYYRTVRYSRPVVTLVPKAYYVRVRAYKPYVVTRRFVRRFCGCRRWW